MQQLGLLGVEGAVAMQIAYHRSRPALTFCGADSPLWYVSRMPNKSNKSTKAPKKPTKPVKASKSAPAKAKPRSARTAAVVRPINAISHDEWITLHQQIEQLNSDTQRRFADLDRQHMSLSVRLDDLADKGLALIKDMSAPTLTRILRIEAMLESLLENYGLSVPPPIVDTFALAKDPSESASPEANPDAEGDPDGGEGGASTPDSAEA